MKNLVLLILALLIWLGVWFDVNYRIVGPDSLMYWVGYRIIKKNCDPYVSQVRKIEVEWKGKRFLIVRKEGKWFKKEGKKRVELISYPVEDFLSELLCAKFSRSFEEKKEYGIGKDRVNILFANGRRLMISLGEDVPGGMGRYAKVGKRVGLLPYHYFYLLDRIEVWKKKGEKDDRRRVKGDLGLRKRGAVKTHSGSGRSRGDKKAGAVRSQADSGKSKI